MARARDVWEALGVAMEKQDSPALAELYAADAVFLEPHNPPHETDKLIQAYLNSWLQAREDIDVNTKRMVESVDGRILAVEWTITYTAGGRRWVDLPRSSWFEVADDQITYQRDYY